MLLRRWLATSTRAATGNTPQAVRINKALKATHSRREADALVAAGAVSVNGKNIPASTPSVILRFR